MAWTSERVLALWKTLSSQVTFKRYPASFAQVAELSGDPDDSDHGHDHDDGNREGSAGVGRIGGRAGRWVVPLLLVLAGCGTPADGGADAEAAPDLARPGCGSSACDAELVGGQDGALDLGRDAVIERDAAADGWVRQDATADAEPGRRSDGGDAPPDACLGAEVCNTQDDDCDGRLDEGWLGLPCEVGVGPCLRLGWSICTPEGPGCDVRPGSEGLETCDGLDNDCDGTSDEALVCVCRHGEVQACFGGPPGTVGVGLCQAGRQWCLPGGLGWGPCEAHVLPAAEVCNGADDDCNGGVDDLPGLGEACGAGEGRCAVGGVLVCGPNGMWCDAQPGAPEEEACNGADDDCDGRTDEDLALGQPCAVGVGACRAEGALRCDPPRVVCGAQPAAPQAEACNGVDDDCDGRTDEDFGAGQPCTAGLGACLRVGGVICAEGRPVCGAEPGVPEAERCDGTDEDCNGLVDDVAGRGAVCKVGVGACEVQGLLVCAGGELSCAARPPPAGVDVCNGADDDCDGRTDEGFEVGQACDVGQGRCLRSGRFVCDDEGIQRCDVVPGAPGEETCDGLDDDCDGQVDEGFGVGQGCEVGQGLCAQQGQRRCEAGLAVCDALPGPPALETCDGWDEDCDGQIDEDFRTGAACVEGMGFCARAGRIACEVGGGASCDARPGHRGLETCDAEDEDCDGRFDEGLGCMAVAAGTFHTCALRAGAVKCWGYNDQGQLGLGDIETRGDEPDEMGANLPAVDLAGHGVKLALGGGHSCALLGGGEIKCWGDNWSGQLGLGDVADRGDGPGEMGDALPRVDLGQNLWAADLCAGREFTCAMLVDGGVKCWGHNFSGQLGLGSTVTKGDQPGEMGDALPRVDLGVGARAQAISCGLRHVCALLEGGAVKCWGSRHSGQLGQPVGRTDIGDGPREMGDALAPVQVGTGRSVVQVATQGSHTCALLDDATVKCWGEGLYGRLGQGNTLDLGNSALHMGDNLLPVDLGAGARVLQVAAYEHTCALLAEGRVKCWGRNLEGRLGLGDFNHRGDQPGEMGDALPFVEVGGVAAIAVGERHTCVVVGGGSIRCWGGGEFGQTGRGDEADRGNQPGEMGQHLLEVGLW